MGPHGTGTVAVERSSREQRSEESAGIPVHPQQAAALFFSLQPGPQIWL
jgi:hypothetical protein